MHGAVSALSGHMHAQMVREKSLPDPKVRILTRRKKKQTDAAPPGEAAGPSGAGPSEEAGPSGASSSEAGALPSDAANEADVVVEDAPSEPEHDYNAPENQPPAVKVKALGTLEA